LNQKKAGKEGAKKKDDENINLADLIMAKL